MYQYDLAGYPPSWISFYYFLTRCAQADGARNTFLTDPRSQNLLLERKRRDETSERLSPSSQYRIPVLNHHRLLAAVFIITTVISSSRPGSTGHILITIEIPSSL